MIRNVRVRYFKRFDDQSFELAEHIVLAGPNNSGKTTLLQAIVIWSLALQKWRERRGLDSGSQAKLRTGVPMARQDFTALPLRLMEHIWTDTTTGRTKEEREPDHKPGEPRVLEITLAGKNGSAEWTLGFEFRYSSSEQLYVRPVPGDIPAGAEGISVVHVPPFSGIGHAETRLDRPFQDLLIGQGKAGDILRNLLWEVYQQPDKSQWEELCARIADLFKIELLPPEYAGTPHIVCEYVRHVSAKRKGRVRPQLDVASAGSGFHQVLLLLGFFYARPATILLLDEPDAHLHVLLQKQVYDAIRRVASKRECQVLVATHSEVLIDNTAPEQILSFYGEPHRLRVQAERDQVREALKRLSAMDILLAESETERCALYVEDQTDADLLAAWAGVLKHPTAAWFASMPFLHTMQGGRPREARAHFFALRAINPNLRAYVLLDGDQRDEPDSEVRADGLEIARWRRYEAESYLAHPVALRRFVEGRTLPLLAEAADTFLKEQLPPVLYREPTLENDYWVATPASKTLLPAYFKAAGISLPKTEYYLVAESMQAGELPVEVREKLDAMALAMKLFV